MILQVSCYSAIPGGFSLFFLSLLFLIGPYILVEFQINIFEWIFIFLIEPEHFAALIRINKSDSFAKINLFCWLAHQPLLQKHLQRVCCNTSSTENKHTPMAIHQMGYRL